MTHVVATILSADNAWRCCRECTERACCADGSADSDSGVDYRRFAVGRAERVARRAAAIIADVDSLPAWPPAYGPDVVLWVLGATERTHARVRQTNDQLTGDVLPLCGQ